MNEAQRKGAAIVAMVVVAIPALLLAWLSVKVLGEGSLGDNQPGILVLAAARSGDTAMAALKGLPLLIATGLSVIIPKDGVDWRFVTTVAAALVGMLCALFLYFMFGNADVAHRMWSFSEVPGIGTYDELEAAVPPKLLALAAWFLSTLGVQLGIKLTGAKPEERLE